MRALADEQAVRHVVSEPAELVDLGEERLRIDDDPVADGARHVRVENSRRQEPQNDLRGADIHRMTGVVPALIARDDGEVRRQQIDDLAFAFISPLRTEYSDVHGRHILHCLVDRARNYKMNSGVNFTCDASQNLSNKIFFIFRIDNAAARS